MLSVYMHMAESNILMRGLCAGNKSANGIESGVQGQDVGGVSHL